MQNNNVNLNVVELDGRAYVSRLPEEFLLELPFPDIEYPFNIQKYLGANVSFEDISSKNKIVINSEKIFKDYCVDVYVGYPCKTTITVPTKTIKNNKISLTGSFYFRTIITQKTFNPLTWFYPKEVPYSLELSEADANYLMHGLEEKIELEETSVELKRVI